MVVIGLGVVLLAVYYRFWYLPSTPPCPPIAEIQAQIRQEPALQQCTDISVEINSCIVRVQGRMESQEQLARLRGVVQNMKGITYINDTSVRFVEAPFCEVIDLLEPVQKH